MSPATYPPPATVANNAANRGPIEFIDRVGSMGDAFWEEHARSLRWTKVWERVREDNLPRFSWFVGGRTNITFNCYDRNLAERGDVVPLTALREGRWEEVYSYQQALEQVCRIANVLRSAGVEKGDRVVVYMPLNAQGVFAMHACARVGAIRCVVYAGIGAGALCDSISALVAKVMVYAHQTYRRSAVTPLAATVQEAAREIKGLTISGCERGDTPLESGPSRR